MRNDPKHEFDTDRGGRAGRRLRLIAVSLVVAALTFVFGIFMRHQYDTLMSVERRIASYNRQIEEQQALTQTLTRQRAIQGSAEYFEQVARERLGLIHRNEIIFRRR